MNELQNKAIQLKTLWLFYSHAPKENEQAWKLAKECYYEWVHTVANILSQEPGVKSRHSLAEKMQPWFKSNLKQDKTIEAIVEFLSLWPDDSLGLD